MKDETTSAENLIVSRAVFPSIIDRKLDLALVIKSISWKKLKTDPNLASLTRVVM